MAGNLQPLVSNQAIVKNDGTPTDYFIRWAQQKQIDIAGSISIDQAQELIDEWAASRQIIAGTGLTGGGDLLADRTLTLHAFLSQLLDVDITTTPPTDGQALVYNSTDEKWEPGSVSGSGGAPELTFFSGHIPASFELLFGFVANSTFYIHTNFPGTKYHVGTNPAATFLITVAKNGTNIGTITITTAGLVTLSSTGTITMNSGDYLSFTGPATADTAIKNFAFNIYSDLVPPPPASAYGRYRLDITANNGDTYVGLDELYLYEVAGTDIATKAIASAGSASASSTYFTASAAWALLAETPGSGGSGGWLNNGGATGFVEWTSTGTIDVRGISIAPRVGETARAPKDFTVDYSDDNATWFTALTVTGSVSWVNKELRQWDVPSSGSHKYWRINVTANNGDAYMGFASLVIGLDTGEVITSNTRNAYLTESSEYSSSYRVYNVLDRGGGYWVTSSGPPQFIEIDMGRSWNMNSFAFKCLEPLRMPKDFTMSGSNDNGLSWTVIGTYTGQTGWTIGQVRTFTI